MSSSEINTTAYDEERLWNIWAGCKSACREILDDIRDSNSHDEKIELILEYKKFKAKYSYVDNIITSEQREKFNRDYPGF